MILGVIAQSAGVDRGYIAQIARTASHRYKTYTIPKKKGGRRVIEHPSKELKFLQSWLADNLFNHLSIHKSVYSYRIGYSIKQHAELHRKRNFMLRADFVDFFPSISSTDIRALLKRQRSRLPWQLGERDYSAVTSIVCRNGKLTIGAPSSPILSNAVMYDFDEYWTKYSKKCGVVYSRYADDIYFSTDKPNVLHILLKDLREWLKTSKTPRLRLNEKKTQFASRKRKMVVTGLVLTSDRHVSVGREKKRYIKSLVFKFSSGTLDAEKVAHLRGYLAYMKGVEPAFLETLARKYGYEVVEKLRKG